MSGIFSLYYIHNGISDSTVSSIKSFQSIGILAGLIPAGILADRFGRLKILIISSLVIAGSFLMLLIQINMIGFSVAEFFYGIGLALNSGTLMSYITALQESEKTEASPKLMGRQVTFLNLATLMGGNIGTWIFSYDMNYPIIFSIVGLLLYPIFIILWCRYWNLQDNAATYHKEKVGLKENIKLLSVFMKSRIFRLLLLINIGFDCGIQFIIIYWSIIYVDKLGFNLSFVYTAFMISVMVGSEIFTKFSEEISGKRLTIAATVGMMLFFLLSDFVANRYVLLLLFLLIEVTIGLLSAQISAISNQAIYGQKDKSKILSIIYFLTEIVVSLSLFMNDILLDWFKNINHMFLVSAVFLVIVLIGVSLFGREESV